MALLARLDAAWEDAACRAGHSVKERSMAGDVVLRIRPRRNARVKRKSERLQKLGVVAERGVRDIWYRRRLKWLDHAGRCV